MVYTDTYLYRAVTYLPCRRICPLRQLGPAPLRRYHIRRSSYINRSITSNSAFPHIINNITSRLSSRSFLTRTVCTRSSSSHSSNWMPRR